MKQSTALVWLAAAAGLLAIISSGAGLFWQDGGQPFTFTTLRGDAAQMYGQGLYRLDTVLSAAGYRGTDAVILLVCAPVLFVALWHYRRGQAGSSRQLRGGLVLTGVLSFLMYNAIHMTMGVAYNSLFLVYTAYLSTSLYAFVLAFNAIDRQALAKRLSVRLPRRGMAIFLFIAGGVVFLVWFQSALSALLAGGAPAELGPYTSMPTFAFDMGIIAPAAILAGVQLLRKQPMGYLLGFVLLFANFLIGVVVIGQTIAQVGAGVTLTPGQAIGFVGSFVVMSGFALYFVIRMLRGIGRSTN